MKTQRLDMLGVINIVKGAIKMSARFERKGWKSAVAGLAMVAGLTTQAHAAFDAGARPPETVLDGIMRTQDNTVLPDPSKDFSADLKREWAARKGHWKGTIFSNLGYGFGGTIEDESQTVYDDPQNPTKASLKVKMSIALDATFTNLVDKTMTILFVREGDAWKMSDISYQDGTTFRSCLRGQK